FHIVGHRDLARVDGEDALASLHVGAVDDDAAIEAARPQERRIEDVGTIGRGDEDHAFVRLEAVHLDEQLVQRLLALVVAAAEAGAAMTADGVDLVDEDDARRVLLALLEQIAHARGADADEHLDEVGSADGEEGDVGFARDRAREERLTRSGRAHQQDALRDASAELLELLRLLQELDDLLEFFLRFVDAGDVLEGDLLLRARRQLRFALAERQRLVAAALHLAHEEDPEADHQQHGRPRVQQRRPRARGRFARVDLDVLLDQLVDEAVVLRRRVRAEVRAALGVAGDVLAGDRDRGDAPRVGPRHELAELHRLLGVLEARGEIPDEHADDDEHHPEQQTLQGRVQEHLSDNLSLKTTTFCDGSVTRNASSIPCPATHTIRSHSSTTIGTESRSPRTILRSTNSSWSFLRPPSPTGRKRSPGRRFLTASAPSTPTRRRSARTAATGPLPTFAPTSPTASPSASSAETVMRV